MKRYITIFLLLISIMIISTACSSNNFVGRWERQDNGTEYAEFDVLEFFSDSTYTSDDPNYSGNYSVDGNRIKFSGILMEPITCSFELNKDRLVLDYDGKIWEFKKVD